MAASIAHGLVGGADQRRRHLQIHDIVGAGDLERRLEHEVAVGSADAVISVGEVEIIVVLAGNRLADAALERVGDAVVQDH